MSTKKTVSQVIETTLAHSKGDENKLTAHVKAITKQTNSVKKSVFEIAVRMNAINTEKLYEIGGYGNIAEWAAAELGYARSTTLNYVKIAERFLVIDNAVKGKQVINTICARRDESGNVTEDYKIGQLNAAGRATADDFVTMDSEGVITPEMSADAIKKAVKAWYDGEPEPEDGDGDDGGNNPESEYMEKYSEVLNLLTWLDNHFHDAPDDQAAANVDAAIAAMNAKPEVDDNETD